MSYKLSDYEYENILKSLDEIRSNDNEGYKLASSLKQHLIKNYQNNLLQEDGEEKIDSVSWTNTKYWIVDKRKKHTLKDVIDYLVEVKNYDWFNGIFKDYQIDIYNGKIVEYKDKKIPNDIFNINIGRVRRYSQLGHKPEHEITFYEEKPCIEKK